MSRVRSLMVSRVMELFWRRCLSVERQREIVGMFARRCWVRNRCSRLTHLATFLLESLLPALMKTGRAAENVVRKNTPTGNQLNFNHFHTANTQTTSRMGQVLLNNDPGADLHDGIYRNS